MNRLNWATKENAERPNNFESDNYVLLQVNILDIMNNGEHDFKLDPFDRTGGKNAIGARLSYAIEHFKSGLPMDYPEAYYSKYKNNVGFDNGRHRAVAAFQLGEEYIPMFVFFDGIDDFKSIVRTKPIEINNIENVHTFLKKKSARNFTREEFHHFITNKFNLIENKKHSIDDLNQIEVRLNGMDNINYHDKQYMKNNGYYSEKDFFLDTNTFIDLFKELNLKEDELNKISIDYSSKFTYDDDGKENENISFVFDFNEFYDSICNKEDTTLVFRVENDNHNGPYKDISVTRTYDQDKNPNAESDNALSLVYNMNSSKTPYAKEYKFGFNSLDNLKSWFHDQSDISKMKDSGFKISVYEVPKNHTLSSDHQTIYKDKSSKLIEKVELNNFFRPDLQEKKVSLRPF
jgi:hypothetical protein